MRRSRAALLLFFSTFLGSLTAVGFADGRNHSLSPSAGVSSLELEIAADDCSGPFGTWEPSDDGRLTAADFEDFGPLRTAPLPAYIVLPSPVLPLLVLPFDAQSLVELSVSRSAEEMQAAQLFEDAIAAGAATDCMIGAWTEAMLDSDRAIEQSAVADGALELAELFKATAQWRPSDLSGSVVTAIRWALPLHAALVGNSAVSLDQAHDWAADPTRTAAEFSTAAWLDQSAPFAGAQFWRAIAQTAADAAEKFVAAETQALSACSRHIVRALTAPAPRELQSLAPSLEEPPVRWPNVTHSTGRFLTL